MSPLRFDGLPDPAGGEVIVDDAARLHGRVDGRRADELEAGVLQPLGQGGGFRRRSEPVTVARRRGVLGRGVAPEELLERLRVPQGHRCARVRDRRLDLPAVPDDRGIRYKPLDVPLVERGDAIRIEPVERRPEALALAQDRQPAETGLEAFEAEPLVEAALVADGASPLLVVVGEVERVGRLPAADEGRYVSSTSTWTMPSST